MNKTGIEMIDYLKSENERYRYNWISVNDKYPDDDINVLVWTGKKMTISSRYTVGDHHRWKGSGMLNDSITHWMYLPEGPIIN